MPHPVLRLSLAVCLVLLAGCSTGPSVTTTGPGTVHVTRPGDYRNDTLDSAPHLHDYWGGQQRLVVVDGMGSSEPGPGVAGGRSVMVHQYRPESGRVVPQGTAQVEATFTWSDAALDRYTQPELWYKTAAQNETRAFGPIESGKAVVLASTNTDNDLPHQLLSAWVFEFRLSEEPTTGILRFKGNATLRVEALRGLEIPLYPGHPDRWGGNATINLLDVAHQVVYLQDPGDGGCDGISCRAVHVPRSGAIVPHDASYVEARFEVVHGSPTTVGLSYHGAEGRSFTRLAPSVSEGNVRTYRIDVGRYGDGPYAVQSQWEFSTYIEGPVPDSGVAEEYRLTVVVHRHL